jgi:hypothetical protein
MATLADVIRSKRKSGQSRTGSFFGSLKDKLKETIDPRQLFNQSGILTALFPSLKAYKAKGVGEETGKLIQRRTAELSNSPQSMNGGMDLSAIEQNTKISAVNSLSLPGMSRDMNLMRQNILKLAKVVGIKPATKADMYFKKSSEREKEYESKFQTRPKLTNQKTSAEDDAEKSKGFLSTLISLIGGLISAITGAVSKLIGGLFSVIQSMITVVVGALKSAISLIVKSLFSLIKNVISKLFRSFTKVFSLLNAGGLARILIGFLSNPITGGALLAGAIAAYLINKAFINDEEKRKLFVDLEKSVIAGVASDDQIRQYAEMRSKGFTTEEPEIIKDASQKLSFSDIGSIREEVSKKPGDKAYRTDDEIKRIYKVERETLVEFINAGARGTLRDTEERLKKIQGASLTPLPEETLSPVQIDPKTGEAITGPTLEQIDERVGLQKSQEYAASISARAQSNSAGLFNTPKAPPPITDKTTQLRESAAAYPEVDVHGIPLPTENAQNQSSGGVKAPFPQIMNPEYPVINGLTLGLI